MEVSTSFDPLDRTTPPDAIAVMMRRLGITWNSPLTTLMYSTRPAKNFEQLAQQQAGLFAKHTVLEECKKLGIDLLHLPPQSLFLQSKMKEDLHASFNTFSSCFKYDSQCQAAIIALGHLYYHLGQYEDSLRQFEKALQYEKDSTSEDRITILTLSEIEKQYDLVLGTIHYLKEKKEEQRRRERQKQAQSEVPAHLTFRKLGFSVGSPGEFSIVSSLTHPATKEEIGQAKRHREEQKDRDDKHTHSRSHKHRSHRSRRHRSPDRDRDSRDRSSRRSDRKHSHKHRRRSHSRSSRSSAISISDSPS